MDFKVEGSIKLGKEHRKFSKVINAETEGSAREKVLSLFGSNNGVRRQAIKIEKVSKFSE